MDLVVGAGAAAERPPGRGGAGERPVHADDRERVPVVVQAGVGDVEVRAQVVLEEVVLVRPRSGTAPCTSLGGGGVPTHCWLATGS